MTTFRSKETQKIMDLISHADQVKYITKVEDIKLGNLALRIAKIELEYNGFYSYTDSNQDIKVLLIATKSFYN